MIPAPDQPKHYVSSQQNRRECEPRMNEDRRETAVCGGFGYGSWNAFFWFIGQEEGKGPKESADNSLRIEAWHKLQRDGLCDCRLFHCEIGETSWHRERPRLQPTWRPLILLLNTFLNEANDNQVMDREVLRIYQREKWGSLGGDTCVIELSGISARNLAEPVDRGRYLQKRIEFILEKLHAAPPQAPPKFVVMYGMNHLPNWERLAGSLLEKDEPVNVGPTVFVAAPHPNTRGRTNEDWIQLGRKLRLAVGLAR